MRSAARYFARPLLPPKPPLRIGTPCGAGLAVLPARERVTVNSSRPASFCASSRASAVPPRIRIRCMAFADPVLAENAATCRWLSIVGIGEDGIGGLTSVSQGLIRAADVVFGGQRHLSLAGPLIRGA